MISDYRFVYFCFVATLVILYLPSPLQSSYAFRTTNSFVDYLDYHNKSFSNDYSQSTAKIIQKAKCVLYFFLRKKKERKNEKEKNGYDSVRGKS